MTIFQRSRGRSPKTGLTVFSVTIFQRSLGRSPMTGLTVFDVIKGSANIILYIILDKLILDIGKYK